MKTTVNDSHCHDPPLCLSPAYCPGGLRVFSLLRVLPQKGHLLSWERPMSEAEPTCLPYRWVLRPVCGTELVPSGDIKAPRVGLICLFVCFIGCWPCQPCSAILLALVHGCKEPGPSYISVVLPRVRTLTRRHRAEAGSPSHRHGRVRSA